MAFNKKEHLRQNIRAIEIALQQGEATAAESEELARYSGFGGLKCVLQPAAADRDIER